ncbi:M20 family metallopeptidase [Anaeropeptidivorans aminofermentans]|jgi:acetylornithine deacetylase|uniref:M20 family metallopeptidase n=1 Tax=Anaeropeptidivorans aminofermentans TaxID=2934315 RepID=UPI002024C47B|nr:ArgE/DapE family deacylase [Anaeropeptidivorans aminofermentans]
MEDNKRIEILRNTLNANKDKYIKRLGELVAIDTHDIGHGIDGGLEKKGQEYMAELFKALGASEVICDQMEEKVILESLEKYNEGNEGHNYDGRFNVYATFKGESEKSILFNGHIDTMPVGDPALWNTNPHDPVIKDGRMYGLGVCDMKAGLMASTLAVELLKDAGIPLPGKVVITSVVDEEGGGNGSIQAAMRGIKADAAVVCEPTDQSIIAAHMGFIFFKIEVEGRAVHSGAKWLGVSAIEKAQKLIEAIDELEHQWLMNYKHALLPAPTSNVGVISGGSAGSTVADYCEFKTCVHYLPGKMSHEQVVKEYTDAIYRRCEGDEWLKDHKPKISIYQAGGAFEMDLDHEFTKTFAGTCEKIKNEAVIVGSPAGCDARVWRNMANMPTLQYGPGRQSECHIANEYVELQQYLDAILIYAQLILDWCK